MKFTNAEELIKSLNDNKKYYLINKPIWNKICKIEEINDKGIPFLFEKNFIILLLNDKTEKLYFKIDGGIIEKSNFIEKKSIFNKHLCKSNKIQKHFKFFVINQLNNIIKNLNLINSRLDLLNSEEEEEEDEEDEDSSFKQNIMNYNNFLNNESKEKEIEFDFKNKIEITLSLYAYEKIIGNIINYSKNLKNEEEYKNYIKEDKGYLINKIWMDKCKNIYLYDKICEYLEYNNLNANIKDDLFIHYKKHINFNNNDLKNADFNVYPESLNLENYKNILF